MVVFRKSSACSTCKTAQGARRNTTDLRGKRSALTSGHRPESSIINQKLWSVGTILGRPVINGRDQQNADICPALNLIPYKRLQLRSFSQFHTDLLQMEEFLAQNLTVWIANLDGSEKLNFRGFGMNALFTLSRTPLHFLFLHVAARFWNPVTHVFSFGGQKVCPTFEDFQALMESECDEEILPQLCFGHAQALRRMCALNMHSIFDL
ncbi:hypothetical protein CsSME_00016374 [Camellia sinensis var. sinensis]